MTPVNNAVNQSGLTKGYTKNKHADSNTDKNKHEEDLELKNAEDTNNDLRVIKQKKKI